MQAEKRLNEGVWRWYGFKEGASVLFAKPGELSQGQYDYVVSLEFAAGMQSPADFIKELKACVKPGGTLLLGFDNSLGYRYFCGDYPSAERKCLSKNDIKLALCAAGITSYKFYSVLPCLEAAQLIYADSFVPTENLSIRFLPLYDNPESVFKFEELGYGALIENGLFHAMANSFLVECNDGGNFDSALQVTLSGDRGEEYSYATIIREGGIVTKRPLFALGSKKLFELQENLRALKNLGINVVDCEVCGSELKMPFVDAPLANVYLQELAKADKDAFIQQMDAFRDLIYKSASQGVCYFDFVPLNAFYLDGDFVFFDQEFALPAKDYPAEMLVYRSLVIVYSDYEKMNALVPRSFFEERYGIAAKLQQLENISHSFLMSLRNQDELRAFNSKHQRADDVVRSNASRFTAKKYHIGYLSGVFDLYHIGHINMFRRAKEMCDYLIVGVTSDEYVVNKKKREPFIPFDERLAVVASCKYVDKAVKVPYLHEEITEAWETYRYDVQFCGSDYADNPWWLAQQKWLREHGSDLVFFSYTEQTSSTKIKALIEKGLL